MKHIITLTFPGVPKAVQSFRFANAGKFARKYQPKETVEWKNYIRILALQQAGNDFKMIPRDTPLMLEALFVFPMNKTARKKERDVIENGGYLAHTKKPDVTDNLMKGMCDALTGTIWDDDCIITWTQPVKCTGITPMIMVKLYEVDNNDVSSRIKDFLEENG